jgi:hypothetical protein
MTQRIVTGLLWLLMLLMLAGLGFSLVLLVAPSGCSDGDLSCSVGSGVADSAGLIGLFVFGPLSFLSGWALQAWRRRHFWD